MGRRFETLDGLRGVAALAAFGHHVQLLRHKPGVFEHGFLAVDFFFLLSGFVMGAAYEARGMPTLVPFLRVRLLRLYPLMVMGALLGLAVWSTRGAEYSVWVALAAQLAFVPFVINPLDAFPLNGVQWSLLFELFANALHAALGAWLTTRRLCWLVAAFFVWLSWSVLQWRTIGLGFSAASFAPGLARAGFSYFAGLLIWRLHAAGRLPVVSISPILVASVLFAALAAPAKTGLADLLWIAVLFPAILIAGANSTVRGLSAACATWLGEISYPLYAIHVPALALAAWLVQWPMSSVARAAIWGAFVASLPAIAWLLGRYVDEPLRAWRAGRARLLSA